MKKLLGFLLLAFTLSVFVPTVQAGTVTTVKVHKKHRKHHHHRHHHHHHHAVVSIRK